MVLGKQVTTYRRLKLDPCPSSHTSINSKGFKYLNVRPKTLKLLQERIGKTLFFRIHIGIGSNFLNRTVIAQQIKDKIDKWDCLKLKSFYIAKETVTRLKR
jgi:hypothetical protein